MTVMLMKIKASAGSRQDLYTSIPGDEDEILIDIEFIKFGCKFGNEIGRSACEYNIYFFFFYCGTVFFFLDGGST